MKSIAAGCSILICLMAVYVETAEAQAVRIQQPIVQQFSAGTTLTIPDRGSAMLGGIQSGAIHTRQNGPFRSGSTYGHSFQSSTSSVGVYIHDFEAMDQMLLNSAPRVLRDSRNFPTAHQHWRNQLMNQTVATQPADSTPAGTISNAREIRLSKAARFYELGQQAEKKHSTPTIAILHYRNAEKYGSSKAAARLQELTTIRTQNTPDRNRSDAE
ncbi:hypothetical protein [Gimesia algae]|uniref:Tetratricopeptide repeat protein n=1 Tax=Gimesia algae TaxID=2527971 RepID=A0A517VGB5_9PLAN|nr:hypothetical protein [Gimesia algae]QDT92040.1 hypothetical protein Pan161_37040 [Gimesia algae]